MKNNAHTTAYYRIINNYTYYRIINNNIFAHKRYHKDSKFLTYNLLKKTSISSFDCTLLSRENIAARIHYFLSVEIRKECLIIYGKVSNNI